jgi:glycosyltransferase involved in cell wall biosynthesis
VLTSKNEASPVSILEAQACGVPVVATQVGSISDTVLDGQTGKLVPAEDDEALAEAMIVLIRDEGLRSRMGCAARENVQRNWSLDRMVRGYEDLIERIYEEKASRYSRPAA